MFLKGETTKPSSWPILMFLGFIFAGPYLMWKLINSLKPDGSQAGTGNKAWATGESEHFVAEAKFSFDAGTERELNLKPGQTIRLAPAKCQPNDVRGWALASDGTRIGLVPLNYIKVMGKRSGVSSSSSFINYSHDSQVAGRSTHMPKPRVRFDLNPRPPEISFAKSEPTGILVRNGNHVETENSNTEQNSESENSKVEESNSETS